MSNEREEAAKKTHEGFTIVCDKCGSRVVTIENSLGWSETSGSWGSITLRCQDCAEECDIYAP